jgi:hypothetical protein
VQIAGRASLAQASRNVPVGTPRRAVFLAVVRLRQHRSGVRTRRRLPARTAPSRWPRLTTPAPACPLYLMGEHIKSGRSARRGTLPRAAWSCTRCPAPGDARAGMVSSQHPRLLSALNARTCSSVSPGSARKPPLGCCSAHGFPSSSAANTPGNQCRSTDAMCLSKPSTAIPDGTMERRRSTSLTPDTLISDAGYLDQQG